MGGERFTASQAEVFEAADPARTMPKWLVFGAVAAVILLIVIMSWLNRRSLDQTEPPPASAPATAPVATGQAAPPPAVPPVAVEGPIVLTATGPAWIQVTDQGKTLFEGQLASGQAYAVPPTAVAPLLKAGKPSLADQGRQCAAPSVGPPGTVVSNVSLKAADLMRQPGQPGATTGNAPARADPISLSPIHLRESRGGAHWHDTETG